MKMVPLPQVLIAHAMRRNSGATARQLRYWDSIGLLRPSVQSTGGRPGVPRLYNLGDLDRARSIVYILKTGEGKTALSLQKLREVLEDGATVEEVRRDIEAGDNRDTILKRYRNRRGGSRGGTRLGR
jgi:DNA-binding transcriptional MerR regulator